MSKTFRPHPTLKAQAAERARLIKLLGMGPEDGTADGRYAMTTGELAREVAKLCPECTDLTLKLAE